MDNNTAKDGNAPKALEPIQRATVEEILELYPDHPQASAMLLNHYNNAPDCHEQEAIFRQVMTLADYYRDRRLPLELLQDRVENDIYDGLRQAAVEAIGKYYRDDPQTYSWLCDRAQNSENEYVRFAAVETIGEYYQDNPQTYSWLCDRAQNSEDKYVRYAAVDAIGKYYQDNPQTYSWLCDRAENSEDKHVRYAAVVALGDYYQNEPQTLALLRDRHHDENDQIQEAALRQISEHYQDDPQTLPLLQGYVESDRWRLRKIAMNALAEHYTDDPQTFPLLLHKLQDPGSHLAIETIQLLAKYCRDNSQTLPILQNFIQSLIQSNDRSLKKQAVKAMEAATEYYRDDPQILPLWLELVQTYHDADYSHELEKAVNLLVQNYREHPQTLAVLHHLLKQERVVFKEKFIALLVEHYRNEPQTLPFLLDIAQNDDGINQTRALQWMAHFTDNLETLPLLRQCIDQYIQNQQSFAYFWVMDTIGECYAGDLQLFSWLKDLIDNAQTPNELRHASVKVLGEHFLSNSEAIELLNELAVHEPDEQIRLTAFRGIAKHAQQTKSDRPDESETSPEISIEIPEIPTDCDGDYTMLRDLLKAQRWQQAERVTYALIREKLGRKIGSVIRLEEVLTLSSQELQTIDRLWTSTSCGHFGFSVQREIYLQCGGTLDGKYPGDEVWQSFCQRVGWIVAGFLGEYEDIKFHLSSPAGHLPLWANVGEYGDCRYEYIFSDRKPPEIDYTKLRNLLAVKQWKEADYETYLLMLQVVDRKPRETISDEELRCFPCTELQTLDQLWVDASQGRFGFSIQKDIYLQCGGVLDGQISPIEVQQEFDTRVGWRVDESSIWFEDLTFSIEAPVGHLPTPVWRTYYPKIVGGVTIIRDLYACIFPRLEACKTS
ncbi:GUN4 domain-containing protein [Microcoleus sp. ARI1-B5]|uniref:GUN4 domain-containing protein n=1 Tax=unclassified Microcoleus TaxID=2642155 RepID=UPI002FD6E2B6